MGKEGSKSLSRHGQAIKKINKELTVFLHNTGIATLGGLDTALKNSRGNCLTNSTVNRR